jgi:hypothetical protein
LAFAKNILVVANLTAASDELCRALADRAAQDPASFTLLVPATGADLAAAQQRVSAAVARLREAGLEAQGSVGNGDPIVAVSEVWDPRRYDEIVVSTLPLHVSKWLRAGLPERIYRLTGAPVTHIVAAAPKPPVKSATAIAPDHQHHGLGPLEVLGWGGRHERERPRRGSDG